VPDHFKFATTPLPSTPQLQTFGSSCSTRSFTYIGQSFWYVTLPSAQLQQSPRTQHGYDELSRQPFQAQHPGREWNYGDLLRGVDSTGIGSAQLTELSGRGQRQGTYQASSSGTLKYTRKQYDAAANSARHQCLGDCHDTSESPANGETS